MRSFLMIGAISISGGLLLQPSCSEPLDAPETHRELTVQERDPDHRCKPEEDGGHLAGQLEPTAESQLPEADVATERDPREDYIVVDPSYDPFPGPNLSPTAKADKDGRTPIDVVVAFLTSLEAGDYERALGFWTWKPGGRIERKEFEGYCAKLRAFDQIRIGPMGFGKSGSRIVWFAAYKDGKRVWSTAAFTAFLENGRWRIAY